jgi:ATP-dependent protease ClpP protease subunit
LTAGHFAEKRVQLCGTVDYDMYASFMRQFEQADERNLVVIEVSTLGGDPEVARMIGEDIRFSTEVAPDRRIVFLGKAAVYSAGVTLMSFFETPNRYLTRGTRMMIHERKLSKQLMIEGPLTTCLASVEAMLNELKCSIDIQNEGFENLIAGSSVEFADIVRKAPSNWYLEGKEALRLGLIAGVI